MPFFVSVRAVTLFAVVLAAGPGPWTRAENAPRELQEREKIRPIVEASLADLREPANPSEPLLEQRRRIANTLAELGPAVVPFLSAEVDLPDQFTFVPAIWALGLLGNPASVEAIREAMAVADREGGGFGRFRKSWCVYALGLAGEPTALLDAAGGKSPVDWMEFMEGMRLSDVVAVMTAPESRTVLADQISALLAEGSQEPNGEEGASERLVHAIRALGWVGNENSLKILSPLLTHRDRRIQSEATVAVGRIGGPASIGLLMKAFDNETVLVRVEAARALYILRPSDRATEIAARLELEDETAVRRWLYRCVATLLEGEAAAEVFRSHRNRGDILDRLALAYALGESGSPSGLNMLRLLLRDDSSDVALAAARAIHEIGGEGATDTLLALIHDPRPPIAQTAVQLLTASGEKRAAPRIAEALLRLTSRPATDPSLRAQIQIRAEALVTLRYTAPIEDLRKRAAIQPDPAVGDILRFAADQLQAIESRGDDVGAWIEMSRSPAAQERALAYHRLSELGGGEATRGLLASLENATGGEEATILLLLAEMKPERAADAFGRRLMDPGWDGPSHKAAREAAAWGARRLGSKAMLDALEQSALRTDGLDFATLAYIAVLSPKRAIPVLRQVFPLRVRHFDWHVGAEQPEVLEMLRILEGGGRADAWDLPPGSLHHH